MKTIKHPYLPIALLLSVGLTACQNANDAKKEKEYSEPVPIVLAKPEQLEEVTVSAAKRVAIHDAASTAPVYAEAMMVSQPMPRFGVYEPEQTVTEHRENYRGPDDNPLRRVTDQPLSTFSIDVDSASYANIRRMILQDGRMPPKKAVRVEEMINYFQYDYPKPLNPNEVFAINSELSASPWNDNKYIMRIGLQGYEPDLNKRPPANLVFLIDVSGSMQARNKLPLLKKSLLMLVENLEPEDTVSLVVYAGAAGVVLAPTSVAEKAKIRQGIQSLEAGGSTHGSAGIQLAYEQARQAFIKGGINRVLIASDGDMNVGITNIDSLKELIESQRKSGVALTTLGFGTGNYNDALMEELADVGNGNAAYIDSMKEAYKVLVHQMTATLHTIANDVKIQVEFNPEQVSEYRLVGYENRMLDQEDFDNDKVDAGDIGLGHQVTAIYELSLKGQGSLPSRRYAKEAKISSLSKKHPRNSAKHKELAYIKLRYKPLQGTAQSVSSQLIEKVVTLDGLKTEFDKASGEHRFAVSVAEFGQRLRGGQRITNGDMKGLIEQMRLSKGDDKFSYRGELINIAELAASLDRQHAM